MIVLKITTKAVITEMEDNQKEKLDLLMKVFCSAVRYSFNRIIEGKKIGDIEKDVAVKYNLNTRQAKDAVENGRQTIASQKELVKMNYENYNKKVKKIESTLKKENLSNKKRNALEKKLEKRKRKRDYWKKFIDNKTIPPVVFGTKQLFIKRCKGTVSKEEWQDARSNRVYSRGDKTKKGNPNLRIILDKSGNTFLEISTLEKTSTNRCIKISVPIYLPRKLSKKTGNINGIDYRTLFLNHLDTSKAYQVEILRKNGKYYCHITFDLPEIKKYFTGHNSIIGIDTNPDGFALTKINNTGNYLEHRYLKQHELLYARSNRRSNLCGELVKEVINIVKANGCAVAIEDLKFKNDIDVTKKFARIKHQFIYSKLLKILESACYREGIEVIKVKPQFTSKIGLYKYCHQYGMAVHSGAALVIARRSYGYKERVPKILKDKFTGNIKGFNSKNEWEKWSIIKNKIKKEGGEKPGLWISNRKEILGKA